MKIWVSRDLIGTFGIEDVEFHFTKPLKEEYSFSGCEFNTMSPRAFKKNFGWLPNKGECVRVVMDLKRVVKK